MQVVVFKQFAVPGLHMKC